MTEPGSIYSPDTSWGSHLAPLAACVVATRGPVLEIGTGNWSTPFLHPYCIATGRRLVSVDEDHAWIQKYLPMHVSSHEVYGVSYDQFIAEASRERWSVVLLDHSPGWRRAADALKLIDSEFLVIHDFSGAEVADRFTPEVLEKWPHKQIAGFSPSSLVLGHREIPAFDKMQPVPFKAKTSA